MKDRSSEDGPLRLCDESPEKILNAAQPVPVAVFLSLSRNHHWLHIIMQDVTTDDAWQSVRALR